MPLVLQFIVHVAATFFALGLCYVGLCWAYDLPLNPNKLWRNDAHARRWFARRGR